MISPSNKNKDKDIVEQKNKYFGNLKINLKGELLLTWDQAKINPYIKATGEVQRKHKFEKIYIFKKLTNNDWLDD